MRSNVTALAVAVAAAALALAACDASRPSAVPPGGVATCLGCHGGTDNNTGAPPRDTAGRTVSPKIGAHTAHLQAGVACQSCHVVPSRIGDAGHINGSAVPVFSGQALLGGAVPVYDPATQTCSNVYCHGAKLPPAAQGPSTSPTWNGAPLAGGDCGSCHGGASNNGAPANHGSTPLTPADCSNCHPNTVDSTGQIIPGGKHINGTFPDLSGAACSLCHGDANRTEVVELNKAAPPRDTRGATSNNLRIGAHQAHLHDGPLGQAIRCSECHVVPVDSAHAAAAAGDGKVKFANAPGDIAKGVAGTLNPAYAAGTCSNVYCHGVGLLGGTDKTPTFNTPSTAACGTCHFVANPPAPHPANDTLGAAITQRAQCSQCHPGTVDTAGNIIVPALPTLSLHINGTKDINFHPDGYAAKTLHGKDARAAGALNAKCKTCHGATFDGGLGGAAPSCTACHTTAGHATWQTECLFCHGNVNTPSDAAFANVGTPPVGLGKVAPPRGAQDEAVSSDNAVGAHQAHIQAGPLANAFQCSQCHGPTLPSNVDHVNGLVVIGWSLAANNTTPTPAAGNITRATAVSCANYCHGATLAGGSASKTVSWTAAPGAAACGTCHGAPPPYAGAFHVPFLDCETCHGFGTVSGIDKAKHVNGTLDLEATITCGTCHGTAANGNFAPPRAASGLATLTTEKRVGAHQAHVKAGPLANAFACQDCHGALPTTMNHANGAVTIAWSVIARTGTTGATAPAPTPLAGTVTPDTTATCANYCHGSKWIGNAQYVGTLTSPNWTLGASQAACGTCHKAPPTSTAHAAVTSTTNCGTCHTGYNCTSGNLAACTVNLADHVNGRADVGNLTCATCHGNATRSVVAGATTLDGLGANIVLAAPPLDKNGGTLVSARGVGAHQAHVNQVKYRSVPVTCTECHAGLVPTSTAAAGSHQNGTANLAGGTLALTAGNGTAGAAQALTFSGTTCSNTYCHGNFKNGQVTAVSWTTGATLGCNGCHGLPPGGTHPANAQCGTCHGAAYPNAPTAATTFGGAPPATHVDGIVQVPNLTCTSCHGNGTRAAIAGADPFVQAAPPVDSKGNSVATARGVGAHLAHVNRGTLRSPIACAECHSGFVPSTVTHSNGVVNLGAGTLTLTTANGNAAGTAQALTFNGTTCSNTYCHGNFKNGLNAAAPWATGATLGCNGCHGSGAGASALAPGGTHPSPGTAVACVNCHTGYTNTTVNLTDHVNGVVNVANLTCSSCHGNATRTNVASAAAVDTFGANLVKASPPVDHNGVTTSTGTGAHLAHANQGDAPALSNAFACAACHVVPTSTTHSNGVTQVTFSGLAAATGATFAAATHNCSNTYCHGNFRGGAGASALAWGTGTNVKLGCTACHGAPPAITVNHPQNANCGACHAGYTATTVNAATHVDGTVQVTTAGSCTACHGTPGRAGVAGADANVASAPPQDATGNTAVTARGVGAHVSHVNLIKYRSAPLGCADCHLGNVPAAGNVTHANGTVPALAGTLAVTAANGNAGAAQAFTWSGTTCSNIYCHGNFKNGALNVVTWNAGTTLACNGCHGLPPAGTHPANAACSSCHTGYPDAPTAATTFGATPPAAHVNGTIDVVGLTCSSCHGNATRTNVASATALDALGANLVKASPPRDSKGVTFSTGTGAHLAHDNQGDAPALSNAFTCSVCHPVPTSTTHSNGTTQVVFSGLAAGAGATINPTTHTCSNTYCHGNFRGGVGAGALAWGTGAANIKLGCTACHGAPPAIAVNHPQNTNCGACHTGYTATTVNAATHVDGTVQVVTAGTCTACHGAPGRAAVAGADLNVASAPPQDATGNSAVTARGVGAHQAHVNVIKFRSAPLGCADCHLNNVPAAGNVTHANGTVPALAGNLATLTTNGNAGAAQAFTWSGTTCSNIYCHGNFRNGALNVMTWNAGTAVACNGCHGLPPGGTHPANTACSGCHTGYPDAPGAATTFGATPPAAHINGTIDIANLTCASCHGNTTRTAIASATALDALGANLVKAAPPKDATGATLVTAAGVGAHQAHVNQATFRSAPITCTECHSGLVPTTTSVAGSHQNGTPDLAGGALTLASAVGNAGTAQALTFNGTTCSNTYCHGNFTNGKNAPMSWRVDVTLACDACHGLPPGGTHPVNTACSSCHGAGYPNAPTAATTFGGAPPATHMNGVLDGGGESAGGSACAGCHASIYATMTGATGSRHLLASDAATDTTAAWASPLNTSVPSAQRSCVNMCHGDHPHDLTTPVVATHQNNLYANPTSQATRANASATRTATNRTATDFDKAAGTGMCTKCHVNPIATGRQTIAEAAFTASAHSGTTTNNGTTTSVWSYTLHDGSSVLRDCGKCHASRADGQTPTATASSVSAVHGTTDAKLLSGTLNPRAASNTTRPVGFVCYNCHGDGTGTMRQAVNRNVWTATQVTYFHPVNQDTRHDTNAEASAGFNSKFNTANRHVNCLDCHDTHQAGRTRFARSTTANGTRNQIPAGTAMVGADGVTVSSWPALPATACAANTTGPTACWPATASTNYGAALATATYEWQVCFKCHSNFGLGLPATSGTFPTPAAGTGSGGLAQTDIAAEFSPNNRSGHPVVTGLNGYPNSATPKPLANLLAPWNTNRGSQTMLCTDCHNSAATSPVAQGPHGSAVAFLLAGTNKRWPYQSNGTTLWATNNMTTSAGTVNGLFCANCHVLTATTTNWAHSRISQHSGYTACVGCHIRVPHGGKISRLLLTLNAPSRYKTGTQYVVFSGIKKAATATTSPGFSPQCAQQHSTTGTEAW